MASGVVLLPSVRVATVFALCCPPLRLSAATAPWGSRTHPLGRRIAGEQHNKHEQGDAIGAGNDPSRSKQVPASRRGPEDNDHAAAQR